MAQTLKIAWTRAALRHLAEAREYIAVENPKAAAAQIARIEASVHRLLAFPMLGRAGMRAGTRELQIPETPYLVVYRLKDDRVEILAVLHGARHWKAEE